MATHANAKPVDIGRNVCQASFIHRAQTIVQCDDYSVPIFSQVINVITIHIVEVESQDGVQVVVEGENLMNTMKSFYSSITSGSSAVVAALSQ